MLLCVGREQMERLIACTDDINDGQPPGFGLLAETELLSIVACVGPRTKFFDVFDLN